MPAGMASWRSWPGSMAAFRVAAQLNALETAGSEVTPAQGATRWMHDPTQRPARATAAGAATIWRNHLVPVGGDFAQTAERQVDTP